MVVYDLSLSLPYCSNIVSDLLIEPVVFSAVKTYGPAVVGKAGAIRRRPIKGRYCPAFGPDSKKIKPQNTPKKNHSFFSSHAFSPRSYFANPWRSKNESKRESAFPLEAFCKPSLIHLYRGWSMSLSPKEQSLSCEVYPGYLQ